METRNSDPTPAIPAGQIAAKIQHIVEANYPTGGHWSEWCKSIALKIAAELTIPAGQRADVAKASEEIAARLGELPTMSHFVNVTSCNLAREKFIADILTRHLTAQPPRVEGETEEQIEAFCNAFFPKTGMEWDELEEMVRKHWPVPPLSDVRLKDAHDHARAVMSNVDAQHGTRSVEKFDALLVLAHVDGLKDISDVRAATDGERLDWLEEQSSYIGGGKGGKYTITFFSPADVECGLMRVAIDAAMTAERGRNGEGAT